MLQRTPNELMKMASRLGWRQARTTGGHAIYTRPGSRSVPIQTHVKVVNPGLSRRIELQLKKFKP